MEKYGSCYLRYYAWKVFCVTHWSYLWALPKSCLVCFVNNTNLIVMDRADSADVVAKWMQELMATWEVLLSTTGGALVKEKFWYMVSFEFQGQSGGTLVWQHWHLWWCRMPMAF